MQDHRKALLLVAVAILLAAGAYLLLKKAPEETSVHRAEVVRPVEKPAKAPDWVDNGQKAEPDYTPSDADPKDVTPVPLPEKDKEPQVVEVTEDRTVTFTFVESLADFLLHRFQPRNSNGKPASLASAVALNKYYGRELDGFNVTDDDIRSARKAVLDYAFNTSMLPTLYELYAPAFMVHLLDTAASDEREYVVGNAKERRTLTPEEIGVMLRLNARRIERTAGLLKAMGENPAITETAGRYRRAAKAVERANDTLQNAIADDMSTTEASDRLKKAILQRERVKAEIITQLKQICHACSEGELFYLSQWAYRRVIEEPDERLRTFVTASEILDDLARRFREESDKLK